MQQFCFISNYQERKHLFTTCKKTLQTLSCINFINKVTGYTFTCYVKSISRTNHSSRQFTNAHGSLYLKYSLMTTIVMNEFILSVPSHHTMLTFTYNSVQICRPACWSENQKKIVKMVPRFSV